MFSVIIFILSADITVLGVQLVGMNIFPTSIFLFPLCLLGVLRIEEKMINHVL